MESFISKFKETIKGFLSGFDRIIFKGTVLPLTQDEGAMSFFRNKGVRNKDFKRWVMEQSALIVGRAQDYAREHGVLGIEAIANGKARKEALARQRQKEREIDAGLIGVFSSLETCWSYRSRFSEKAGYPQLHKADTKCKHLYFYFDHPEYGFMHVRLQTWFPYAIQVALNGREWLRRSLQKQNIDFAAETNKFLYIEDYGKAQRLLDEQLDIRWAEAFDGLRDEVFPGFSAVLTPHLSYYWSLWQSEWATDFIFRSPDDIAPMRDALLRHAFATGNGVRVLRYMDRPLKKNGQPMANLPQDVLSRFLSFNDGLRVRHWTGTNSVKCYNESNVLRVETTVNNPAMFYVYRHAQGESPSRPKALRPLRKGIADVALRAEVSGQVNQRFVENLSTLQDRTPLGDLFDGVVTPFRKSGRRIRGLDPTGKDRALLGALSDPKFLVDGVTNQSLRAVLQGQPGFSKRTAAQLSGKVSRQLRLLRDHGLIRKVPRRNRYHLTAKGQQLTTSLCVVLDTDTKSLMEKAA